MLKKTHSSRDSQMDTSKACGYPQFLHIFSHIYLFPTNPQAVTKYSVYDSGRCSIKERLLQRRGEPLTSVGGRSGSRHRGVFAFYCAKDNNTETLISSLRPCCLMEARKKGAFEQFQENFRCRLKVKQQDTQKD